MPRGWGREATIERGWRERASASGGYAWERWSKFSTTYFLSGSSLRTRLTVCLIFPIRKLISRLDSVSLVCRSGILCHWRVLRSNYLILERLWSNFSTLELQTPHQSTQTHNLQGTCGGCYEQLRSHVWSLRHTLPPHHGRAVPSDRVHQ